jgi:class 3 adenylate cyclase
VCALFAATHPERVSALVLTGAAARGSAVLRPEVLSTLEQIIDRSWGKGELIRAYAPSMTGDERFRRWAARLERNSVSPRGARQILRMASRSDVTDALPRIEAPTLVLHRRDDPLVPVDEGRAVAAAIPGARFVELDGSDSMVFVGDADALLDEIEEFLTGARAPRRTERALATVLFTDIVGSTDLAARLSDRPWRDLLVGHDQLVRKEIERGGGRVIKTVGDGVLATFDRPGEAVRAACSIVEAVGRLGLRLRAGLHTGEVELVGDDVGGLAVHIGARIMSLAEPQQVCVSGTVRDILVGSGLEFASLGTHELRGVPGRWPVYAVAPTG